MNKVKLGITIELDKEVYNNLIRLVNLKESTDIKQKQEEIQDIIYRYIDSLEADKIITPSQANLMELWSVWKYDTTTYK